EEGRAQGSIMFHGEAMEKAIEIMCGFQGAMQMERTLQNGCLKILCDRVLGGLKP
ncbi:MAG: hypothetical protein HRU15_05320, partial [Planctomycetes bacterium]|nr:hypothetical protein [Planctomycetota bacterium]